MTSMLSHSQVQRFPIKVNDYNKQFFLYITSFRSHARNKQPSSLCINLTLIYVVFKSEVSSLPSLVKTLFELSPAAAMIPITAQTIIYTKADA